MNPATVAKRLLVVVALLGMVLATNSGVGASSIHYVKVGGTGDGSSWDNASDLQTALETAASGAQIWVAAGTYTPSARTVADDARTATFQLKNGVAIYGGFAGGESSLDERNWEANITTLSGDIGASGDIADNVYHVVLAPADLDSTAILDGFTISDGNANVNGYPDDRGGGVFVDSSSPTFANLVVSDNQATYMGGGLDNELGAPTLSNIRFIGNSAANQNGGGVNNFGSMVLTNVSFSGNSAHSWGGGLYTAGPTLVATNVTFDGNHASVGGGMVIEYGSATLTNAVFSGNEAPFGAGGLFVYGDSASATVTNGTFSGNVGEESGAVHARGDAAITLVNCILWGDTGGEIVLSEWNGTPSATVSFSIVEGGYSGTGNVNADPLFVGSGDLHIQPGSAAIDRGDNGAVPGGVTTDLDGSPRFKDDTGITDGGAGDAPIVDIGAYEFQGTSSVTNQPPVVSAGNDVTIDEGSVFDRSGSFTDPNADAWTATVNYGEAGGVAEPLALSRKSFRLNHVYADNGVYEVTVAVNDGIVTGTDTVVVTVNNVAPAVNAGADTTIEIGSNFYQSGSFTDPGADAWTATVDYGDGTGPQSLTLNADKSFTLDHTYAATGSYVVTVVVTETDTEAASGQDTVTVTVDERPAAPEITGQPTNQTVVAGSTATFIAAANGTPAPTVQWQECLNGKKKWANIAGATSPELNVAAQLTDSGKQYRAVFSNSEGSVTTSPAVLTVNKPSADVSVTQSGNYDSKAKTITWTLTVTNNGSNAAQSVVVTDSLSKWSKAGSVAPGQGSYKVTGKAVTITVGDLAPGASCTITIVETLGKKATGTINNTAVVTTASLDPNPESNTSVGSVSVP